MSNGIQWSLSMNDDDFVKVSEKYFKRNFIDLHIGCCLIAKVDPETKDEAVGLGYRSWDDELEPKDYDRTRRPFLVAMRALNKEPFEPPLQAAEDPPKQILDARDITLSTRTFIRWVIDKWPDTTGYLRKAEDHYAKNKSKSPAGYLGNKKSAKDQKWAKIRAEFDKMTVDIGEEWTKMSDRSLAGNLEKCLKGKPYAVGFETLRKRIANWRKQVGSLGQ